MESTFTMSTEFFSMVTEEKVLAVVGSEVGNEQVETLLARLTSWNVNALAEFMTAKPTALSAHNCIDELPTLTSSENTKPVVVRIEGKLRRGVSPLKVYAVQLTLEGWCIFTPNVNTLRRLLTIHNAHHDILPRENNSPTIYGLRHEYLVPRATASHRIGMHRFLLYRYDIFDSIMEFYKVSWDMDVKLYHYILFADPNKGWFLAALFDIEYRMHKIVGRYSWDNREAINLSLKEGQTREYLMALRPFFRRCKEETVCKFLKYFTGTNTVRWDEARELLCGEMTLKQTVFPSLLRLPLSYLQQHALPHLYTITSDTYTLTWTPLQHIKTVEDVLMMSRSDSYT
ncbi:hypothetical protein Pcinc_014540 [Petrolisthes cinctipes]|uniref:Uncharacterized protein n=1 Tax=Petrolisthes cinctipes TaxID=88211 RepID=A0AAE1KRA1_PETCI|nr:hypothetical protein Pcinc_014537 [Petrolisthes cinctipes]KAK3880991.1 hypothetical protein Pcinc_014540 [Petrolisthes cinctipes]